MTVVDEDFLTLTTEHRDAGRDEARRAIVDWLDQSTVFGAAAGPLHPDGVAALADTAGRSDLGTWPWHALAGALLSDVEEREMRSWVDFLDYCAGATVAPAAIFIYLLAARYDPAGGYRYDLPRAARDYAKDLAVYCYIVHILRDLGKDAGQSPPFDHHSDGNSCDRRFDPRRTEYRPSREVTGDRRIGRIAD